MTWSVEVDDCRHALARMPENSIDSALTDPPYELGFMGKRWDASGIAYDVDMWRALLRVLKPGAYMLAFGGTRTYHRMVCAIEDAGFEVRDSLDWVYLNGFPKSMDVSKAIDSAAGAPRDVVGFDESRLRPNRLYASGAIGNIGGTSSVSDRTDNGATITAPATALAKKWSGWGTALKPAHEPIVLVRKPLDGTVSQNISRWGVGALNIAATRVPFADADDEDRSKAKNQHAAFGSGARVGYIYGDFNRERDNYNATARWPSNMILDEELSRYIPGNMFYVPKPDRAERDAGCEELPLVTAGDATDREDGSAGLNSPRAGAGRTSGARNIHPTVKPIDLGRYLSRLITPPGGRMIDPFFGSASLGIGGMLEGFDVVGIELDTAHACIAWYRMSWWEKRGVAADAKAASVTTVNALQPELF